MGAAPAKAQSVQRWDSAGVTVVQHPTFDPDRVALWRIEPEPELVIGMVDGPEEYLLMNPLAAAHFETWVDLGPYRIDSAWGLGAG